MLNVSLNKKNMDIVNYLFRKTNDKLIFIQINNI